MPAQSAPINVEESVFLSYCQDDDEWRDRFVSHLGKNAQTIRVFDDRVDEDSDQILSSNTRSALESAKVMFVFLSPGYLRSSWITTFKNLEYVEILANQGLRIHPVLLHECQWQEIPTFRLRAPFAVEGKPITSASPEQVDALFSKLTELVVSEVEPDRAATPTTSDDDEEVENLKDERPLSELSQFKVSDEVTAALDRATRLAMRTSRTSHKVSTSCLLFGLAEGGRGEAPYRRTPQFLFERLLSGGEGRYKEEMKRAFPKLKYPESGPELDFDLIEGSPSTMTTNILNVFEQAEQISLQTRRSQSSRALQQKRVARKADPPGHIGARHLLAALLVLKKRGGSIGAIKRLSRVITDLPKLRGELFQFIKQSLPDDDHEAWKSILIDLKPVAEPVSIVDGYGADDTDGEDLIKQPGVAGFMTDYWDGRDLLGITRDVNALASLVAAYKVEPPLAIGLFGEWGSGKSHFMRQMKKRVEKLSRHARKSPLPQKDVGYYKNIVQIEFNAWHYIEGNLWASLVDHIFANLRISEREKLSIVEARRDEMMKSLGVQKELEAKLRQRIEERKSRLAVKATEARTEADKVQTKLDGVSQQLTVFRDELKTNLTGVPVSVSLSKPEEDLLKQVGIDPTKLNSVRDLRDQYQNVTSGWSRVVAQWTLFWKDPRVARRWVFAALLVVIPLLVAYLWHKVGYQRPILAFVVRSFVATLLAAKPTWAQFQKALRALEKREQDIEADRQQKERRVLELQNELILSPGSTPMPSVRPMELVSR